MAENPVATLARLLGGVVLMQGNLGHQVLGQLLVMNTNEVAIAGASVVVAATSRQQNAVAQIALRTAVPALAARFLIDREQKRLDRRLELLDERERRLSARKEAVGQRESELNARRSELEAAGAAHVAAADKDKHQLQTELDRVMNELQSLKATRAAPKRRALKKSDRKPRSPKKKTKR